ncbi:MAG: tetratricopeptide repeat protein [Gammaproteobacteria bacterium]|nr:tetratricopeptide repeat protein [Gammaproteobacteria bacterium]
MKSILLKSIILAATSSLVVSCAMTNNEGTLASLDDIKFEVKEEKVDGSLEKALASYQKYLDETPESELTPEALRRVADLKIQKDYIAKDLHEESPVVADKNNVGGELPPSNNDGLTPVADSASQATDIKTPDTSFVPITANKDKASVAATDSPIADISEGEKVFSARAGKKIDLGKSKKTKIISPDDKSGQDAIDLQEAGAKEAIELYKGLLKKYPLFERNDQVLYQLSRAYEEIGEVDIAMKSLEQLIKQYPLSRHIGEAYFRRAEYFFTRKRYLDAEESYQYIINSGEASEFYELALYKQGWAYFKQDMYEEALQDYIAMLDYKIANGYELDNVKNKIEKKRIDDTYRVISLSFSYLGGAESVVEYFDKHGHRYYEASIYSHLGEYYLTKRRYSDSALSYQAYVDRNPVSKESPYFNIRVIEIYKKGGFPKLVVDAKKEFSNTYSLQSNYWTFFDINEHPTVLGFLKSNLIDLANHYHALYQDKRLYKQKEENYQEAIAWYRQYLESFPEEKQAPTLNNQLAGLLLENKDYLAAANEYERTAYNYLTHADSAGAGYAAVYSYREHLKVVSQSQRSIVKREIIRSSLKFSDYFPTHKHAAVVLVAAVDDLYALEDYEQAISYGRRAIKVYPNADKKLLRSAWMVVAHASFDLANYKDAEDAYSTTLSLTDKKDKSYASLTENLAASVYKQGEQARVLGDHKLASMHFLRVAEVAPNSKIRPTAEYDAAASLMLLKEWGAVASVLEGFRKLYPKNDLQKDITKKLAVVYKENGEYLKSAVEFERIEKENPKDNSLRREALTEAAELYVKVDEKNKALSVYTKMVDYFPTPIEGAIESRQKMADIYLEQGKNKQYVYQLKQIVAGDAVAGKGRTDRTKFLAANASLILAKPKLDAFKKIALVKPFKKNLKKKKQRMRSAIDTYSKLVDYQVGEVTAAATYYIAEIYFEFNVALMESERPTNLSADELEEYELVIEDQAYPFEEKAISVHEKNMELLDVGIYNKWIDKSITKLAVLLPARYAKTEQSSTVLVLIQPGEFTKKEIASVDPVKEESSDEKNTDSSVEAATPVDEEVLDETVTLEQNVVASEVTNETKVEKTVQAEDDNSTNVELGDKQ